MPPTLQILVRNRDFRRLFSADLIGLGADWFVQIPLLSLLLQLTGSGVWGALVLAADVGVIALLQPYAGVIADRFDRRRILITAELAMAVATLALLLVRTGEAAWAAVAAIGVIAVAKAFFVPAASAALPNVVDAEDLPAANALSGSAWGTMLVVGASLGGISSAVVGPYWCFAFSSALCFLSAVQVARVHRPLQATIAAVKPQIGEAVRYIRRHPRVASLVTVKAAVGLGNGVLTTFPLLAAVYGVGPLGVGLLFAARGLGALIGPFVLRRVLTHPSWLLPGLAVSMSVYGLTYLAASAAPWFPLLLVGVVVAHLAAGGNWMMSNFALQTEVPDALRGRVFATDVMLALLSVGVSQLIVGGFVDRVDPRLLTAVCGGVTLVYAAGWAAVTRRLRRAVS
ncbi:MFS transporter [Dactylosporangium aurantiacum]|uniref:MFS transporter n=1 Tax=Dactylosporangium aurantiacum TaxID=35754 RepID=A0A9Q9IMS5_9ACTN|nr:MFS transporter [Dactylosporangium aurantiacum]MDG6106099.1 MFS transporter [Dactylosporangium aurantiacum]UWZ55860.1 MFS transporter [Dactylosporangium aurantiacum]